MLSPLGPLRFERTMSKKPAASKTRGQQAPFLPEEQEAREQIQQVGLPGSLGFASELKKLETHPEPEKVRQSLYQEAGVQKVRPVANRRTGQQGVKIEDVAKGLQELSRKRGNVEEAIKRLPPDKQQTYRLAHAFVNLIDEATYQLSKGEHSGVNWYNDHISHMETGLAHLVDKDPAFKSLRGTFGKIDPKTGRVDQNTPRQVLFKALLAPTSYGQNPVLNFESALRILSAAAKNAPPGSSPFAYLPPRNPDVPAKDFNTGEPKLDSKGKPVMQGWSIRGSIVAQQLELINRLVRELGEAGAAKWLREEHTAEELKAVKPNVNLPHGSGQKYPGSYVFGPKGGAFFQNVDRNQKELTKDMWWSRTWNRLMGNLVQGGEIQDVPRSNAERRQMDALATKAASQLGLTLSEFQATLWYYEQALWRSMGGTVESHSFKDAIHNALRKRGLEPPRLGEAGTEDEARRQAAVSGATRRSVTRHSRRRQEDRLRLSRAFRLRYAAVAAPSAQTPTQQPIPQTALPSAAVNQPNPVEEHKEHLLAFSPNVDDLSFEDALARSRSGNHKSFKQIIQHINEQIGLKAKINDAIGDWSDGAENSFLQQIDAPVDQQTVDYLASWYGLLANQKSVLAFTPSFNGLDSVYQIELPSTDLGAVRHSLDAVGIPFRTLVPNKKGTKVVIYDEKRELRDKVALWAGKHNATIRESIGAGRFIGGSTRTAARSAYRKNITAYESAAAKSGGKIRAYQPPAVPNHIRTGAEEGQEKPIQQSRQGQVSDHRRERIRFSAIEPRYDVSIPRDSYNPQAELHRLVSAFQDFFARSKETFQEAYRRHGKKKKKPPVQKFAGVQSPAGGVVVRGLFYPGGKYIPSANLEKANYEQYQNVERQRAKFRREDGSVSVEPALKSEGAKVACRSM